MDAPPGMRHATVGVPPPAEGPSPARTQMCDEVPCEDIPHGKVTWSADRGEKTTGGAIQCEPSVLPGRLLAQSREPLDVAPHRTWIRFELIRQRVRLGGVLLRQIQPLHDRFEHRLTRRAEFLGCSPENHGTIESGIRIE